jgi:KDO2-lipid IV(A) lauroyltransferase
MFVCLVQTLSPAAGARMAARLGWLFYHVDRRHRLVADENLRHAYPQLCDAERDRMVRAVYVHFCGLLVEIIQLPRLLNADNWRRHLSLPDGKALVDALLGDRPVLFVTGHFGNWEMAGYALGLLGFTTHAIARPLDNPYCDDFLRRFRERTGQRILAKHGDFDKMQAILDNKGVIATLADQDAGPRGMFVDFFGRPASTHKAVAIMAIEHRVTLAAVTVRKVGEPSRYEQVMEDIIHPEEYADRPDAIKAMTQRFTSALERGIRRAPEQYFWLHRRWKHQPKAKQSQQAA